MEHSIINLFHILVLFPLFLYVGYYRNESPIWIYSILFGFGLITTLYHIHGAMNEVAPLWVHMLHFCLIGPLLMYIGYNARDTGRSYYEMLLVIAFGSLYHLLNYMRYK